jgi:hypothetical protein
MSTAKDTLKRVGWFLVHPLEALRVSVGFLFVCFLVALSYAEVLWSKVRGE